MNSQCELLLTFADELRDAGKLCATIARAKMSEFISRRFIPRAKDDTATVSFIELEERTYAVTAHHVIKGFQAQAEADGVAAEGLVRASPVPYAPQSPRRSLLRCARSRDAGLGKTKAQARMSTSIGRLRVGRQVARNGRDSRAPSSQPRRCGDPVARRSFKAARSFGKVSSA